jgi:hypothetical protein
MGMTHYQAGGVNHEIKVVVVVDIADEVAAPMVDENRIHRCSR